MFLGMRGTGDWVADQRPMNWRQNILYLYPNGMTPLTAILSMMGQSKVDDPQFHWWTQAMGSIDGAVTGVFTLPDLSVAYVGGAAQYATLYVVISAANGERVVAGKQILLRDASDYRVDVVGKIENVVRLDAHAVLTVTLLEADDNSPTHDLSDL